MDGGEYCILREETVRERRGSYNGFCCRLYPFICWIIIKEGPGNFSGGRSPHWVNHVNLCLSCIMCLLCFVSAFVLFYCSAILFFLTKCPITLEVCILSSTEIFYPWVCIVCPVCTTSHLGGGINLLPCQQPTHPLTSCIIL
jgi:hypothetical protein